MATGTGKTVLFAMQARKRGGALVIAHEESLIDQAAQKLRHVTGDSVAIEKAERSAYVGAKYIVASMQTLRGERLALFAKQHAGINFIVIDEAHRAVAKSYRDILAAFPAAKVLGVTATADRGDKKALALVFEKANDDHGAAFKYDIADACADGWLVFGDEMQLDVDGVRLDDIGTSTIGGEKDLDQGQLDVQVALQAGQIAKSIVGHCKGERTLIFAPGVETTKVGAEAINRREPGAARAIYGTMDASEKKAIKAAHARGDFPYLLNCQILIEGYDDPRLSNIVMLSKTKSRARFAQIYGRGTRPWPSTVDECPDAEARRAAIAGSPKAKWRFFDANYGRHGHTLASATDLLGGRFDEETRARAKKNLAAAGGGDVMDALNGAAEEIALAKRRKLARAALAAASASGDVLVRKGRPASEMFGESVEIDDGLHVRPFELTAWLKEQGVDDAERKHVDEQKRIRRAILERKRLGLGSWRQVRRLNKLAVPGAKDMTARRCGMIIGKLKGRPFNARSDAWMLR
jgi:superfamily II DNA or RNA helicase